MSKSIFPNIFWSFEATQTCSVLKYWGWN